MSVSFRSALQGVLNRYAAARAGERFGKASAVWRDLTQLPAALASAAPVAHRDRILVKASAGQGAWARIPWIAFLHRNITTSTRDGVYVIYLFRADMSGVYLTLNQGVTRPFERVGKEAGLLAVRERATKLRAAVGSLAAEGFSLEEPLDLRSDYVLAQRYTASTIAHRLYDSGSVPSDDGLMEDLDRCLGAYEELVRSGLASATT